jgi:hypothetical protein
MKNQYLFLHNYHGNLPLGLGILDDFFNQNRRPFLDDFLVILDDILDGFPTFRRFLDDFLKVAKYYFLRIQAFRKINKA